MTSSPSSDCSLIAITPKAEEIIVYCGRVSNPKNQENIDTAPKLLRYLIKHQHWSPFEMANMIIEINTTRAISAQIIRHRSFSYQEFSQRYADVDLLGKPKIPSLRRQDAKNKQNSFDDLDAELLSYYDKKIKGLFAESHKVYKEMLEDGIAKETAREILPLASPTRIYMNGTIRSWIHYLQIRSGVETQLEHRLIAIEIKKIFREVLPNTYQAVFED